MKIFTWTTTSGLGWKEVEDHCKKAYGSSATLASFHSEREILSVTANLKTAANTLWTGGYFYFWRKEYIWADNSPKADQVILTRLVEGEDNETSIDIWFFGPKECLYLDPLTVKFGLDNCNTTRSFICQTGIKQYVPPISFFGNSTTISSSTIIPWHPWTSKRPFTIATTWPWWIQSTHATTVKFLPTTTEPLLNCPDGFTAIRKYSIEQKLLTVLKKFVSKIMVHT